MIEKTTAKQNRKCKSCLMKVWSAILLKFPSPNYLIMVSCYGMLAKLTHIIFCLEQTVCFTTVHLVP